MSQEIGKKAAAHKALEFVKNGMVIGLGTGSTATYFIENLIEKCHHGLKIEAVASSTTSEELAKKGKIPLRDINSLTMVDLTVDGADEIDTEKRLIKGGGGALVREKILAAMSREWIVIADEKKLVQRLGKHPLPVEILPFGATATKHHIEAKGYKTRWRDRKSDNGNLLLDILFEAPLDDPEQVEKEIRSIPGVVDTGFFFGFAKKILVGKSDGSVITY